MSRRTTAYVCLSTAAGLLVCAAMAVAVDTPPQGPAISQIAPQPGDPSAAGSGAPRPMPAPLSSEQQIKLDLMKKVTLEFKNEPVKKVLETLSEKYNLPIQYDTYVVQEAASQRFKIDIDREVDAAKAQAQKAAADAAKAQAQKAAASGDAAGAATTAVVPAGGAPIGAAVSGEGAASKSAGSKPDANLLQLLDQALQMSDDLKQKALDRFLSVPINLNVKDISLRSALDLILAQCNLNYVIKDEVLLITTDEAANSMYGTRLYNVRDLVQSDNSPSGTDFDSLVDAIQATVNPQSWDKMGGQGSIAQFNGNGVCALIVVQNYSGQEQIENLLIELRRLKPARVYRQ